MHVYTCIIRFMHDTAKRSAIQGLLQKRSVRAVAFDYGNVLCLEQTLEDMKGMALVCGIPHERPQDILYLDDRAENVEAAAGLGINSVLFDTVEKTASRVESRFDVPAPSYGRRRQSSSQYSSTNRRPDRMESD